MLVLYTESACSPDLLQFLQKVAQFHNLDFSTGYDTLFDCIETDDDNVLDWNEFRQFFMNVGWADQKSKDNKKSFQTSKSMTNTNKINDNELAETGNQSVALSKSTVANTNTIRPGDIQYVIERCDDEMKNIYTEIYRTTSGTVDIFLLTITHQYDLYINNKKCLFRLLYYSCLLKY